MGTEGPPKVPKSLPVNKGPPLQRSTLAVMNAADELPELTWMLRDGPPMIVTPPEPVI